MAGAREQHNDIPHISISAAGDEEEAQRRKKGLEIEVDPKTQRVGSYGYFGADQNVASVGDVGQVKNAPKRQTSRDGSNRNAPGLPISGPTTQPEEGNGNSYTDSNVTTPSDGSSPEEEETGIPEEKNDDVKLRSTEQSTSRNGYQLSIPFTIQRESGDYAVITDLPSPPPSPATDVGVGVPPDHAMYEAKNPYTERSLPLPPPDSLPSQVTAEVQPAICRLKYSSHCEPAKQAYNAGVKCFEDVVNGKVEKMTQNNCSHGEFRWRFNRAKDMALHKFHKKEHSTEYNEEAIFYFDYYKEKLESLIELYKKVLTKEFETSSGRTRTSTGGQ